MSAVHDQALAIGFRDGDPAAVDALVRRHTPRLRAILARRGCPHQEREDVVQRTWLRAVAARERLDPVRPFGAWIAQIAIRLWVDDLRRSRTRTEAGERPLPDGAVEHAACPAGADGADGADRFERDEVLRALVALPPEQREAILLTQYEGLSMREASQVTDTGVPGVKSRVSRGYATMRGFLDEPGSRPPLPDRRSVELEVAGCERCEEVLKLVRAIACPSCDVEVRVMQRDGPRLIVDGRTVVGLDGALGYAGTLRALGIGLCGSDGTGSGTE